MDKRIKKLWRKALLSKDYGQCYGWLKMYNKFDVLGILCELHRLENGGEWVLAKTESSQDDVYSYLGEEIYLPDKVVNWAGLQPKTEDGVNLEWLTLSRLNDDGNSFRQLAIWIKENISEEETNKQLNFTYD